MQKDAITACEGLITCVRSVFVLDYDKCDSSLLVRLISMQKDAIAVCEGLITCVRSVFALDCNRSDSSLELVCLTGESETKGHPD